MQQLKILSLITVTHRHGIKACAYDPPYLCFKREQFKILGIEVASVINTHNFLRMQQFQIAVLIAWIVKPIT